MIISQNSKLSNKWVLAESSFELVNSIKETFKCSFLTSKIIANKNLPFEEIHNFLNPTLKHNWIDPASLPNIDFATQQIADVIENKKKVGIIGDYDVDGICSSVILKEFFESFDIETIIWIPTRQNGYGPSDFAIDFFNNNPVDLLILVDCGTNSHDFYQKYNKPILIIDHHHSLNPIPLCVVNPNTSSENINAELKELCATSLTFLIASHILKKLNHKNYQSILSSFLDLTALATVCDMMPFNHFNRAIVKSGLNVLEKQERIGLRQLINFANIKFPMNAKDIGFAIGPRINATGRIESPEISLNLLKSKSFDEANQLIHRIELINNYRKDIQKTTFIEASDIAKNENNSILCLASENWNPGIVGIVAAMVQNEENKPCIVGSIINNEVKASARSSSINIGMLIERAVELGILLKGGGHKFAAGLTCSLDKWEEFKSWINNQPFSLEQNEIFIDSLSTLADVDTDFKRLAPFGLGNEEPKILVNDLYISKLIDKNTYHLVILEESFQSFSFFVNQSKAKLIEELKIAFSNRVRFSAIFTLQEKNSFTLEDINY